MPAPSVENQPFGKLNSPELMRSEGHHPLVLSYCSFPNVGLGKQFLSGGGGALM